MKKNEKESISVEGVAAMLLLLPSSMLSNIGREIVKGMTSYMLHNGIKYVRRHGKDSTVDGFLRAINPATNEESILCSLRSFILHVHFLDSKAFRS